ncbi:MAG: hypothetical protein HQK77_11165 [Desulfobacterales bacterium]|nr:hypothetical protein [Desulfobacterales bacterium]
MPQDGWKYKGRGLIQITGRTNYIEIGIALNLPLELHPELLEKLSYAAMSATYFWESRKLNEPADKGMGSEESLINTTTKFIQLTYLNYYNYLYF